MSAATDRAEHVLTRADIEAVPRRNRLDQLTEAERAIYDAQLAVEAAGADPLLTEAVELLTKARARVAEFVDLPRLSPADRTRVLAYLDTPEGRAWLAQVAAEQRP